MADHRLNKFLSHNSQSFTLIEILITVAIIAVLMTVVVLAINPTEITKKARDTQRLTDMANLEMLLQLARSEGMLNTSYCDGTKIYASLPSETPLSNNNLPAGISWAQVSEDNIRKPDGTGWIPLNFKSLNYLQTSVLPVDPKNNLDNSLYYTFYCNPQRQYIFTAYPESKTFGPKGGKDSKTIADGGPDPYVYEVGNNLFISPLKPVGSWSFEEGSGTIAADSSGNNNNGILMNGPTWTTGQVGGALSFDGSDDYVIINKNITGGFTGLTAEVWVFPTKTATNIFGGSNYAFLLHLHTNVGAAFYLVGEDGTASGYINYKSGAIKLNQWNYIVATWDGSVMRLFVNTEIQNQQNFNGGSTGKLRSSLSVTIGNYFNSSQTYFGGLIDEPRIYNRALSAEEIKRHYEESK